MAARTHDTGRPSWIPATVRAGAHARGDAQRPVPATAPTPDRGGQAARAAARTKGTYLAAQSRRLAARRGRATAAVAVAHAILVIAYHLLTQGTIYRDLGGNNFDDRNRQAVERRLVHHLQGQGYRVSLEPVA
jgi:hypothetical protein